MQKLIQRLLLTLCVALIAGCAHHPRGVDRHANNQFVTEFYAWVDNVEKIQFESHVGQATAIGALDGLLHNTRGNKEAMFAGAIIGGLFGGLVMAIIEGDSTRGYEYQLEAIDGDLVSVIVSNKSASEGQCVSVRVAGDVRLTRQPTSVCLEAEKEYPDS